MARNIFFSFHYQRDIMRVQQVKQHYLTKGSYAESGFFDGSLEEKAKKDGDAIVKNMIDKGLVGSSVLCVLIGKETYQRRWVDYEIHKAVAMGMGVVGVRIHQLKHPRDGADTAGENPFYYLGYETKAGKMHPVVRYNTGWRAAPYQDPISASSARYLSEGASPVLSNLFNVHDWVDEDGYNNFGDWVEAAAKQAGR